MNTATRKITPSRWYTVEEVSRIFQKTPETVRRWLRDKDIKGIKVEKKGDWRTQGKEIIRKIREWYPHLMGK